jgi:hypothetical protein
MSRWTLEPGAGWRIGLSVVAAVLAGLVWTWFVTSFDWVTRDYPQRPRGEAARNPMFVLGQGLRNAGRTVQMRPDLAWARTRPGPRDTLLIAANVDQLPMADRQRLLAWVEAGGHLVMQAPDTGAFGWEGAGGGPPDGPFTSALGLTLTRRAPCARVQVPGDEVHEEFCFSVRVASARTPFLAAWRDPGRQDSHPYVRIAHGRGTVDVLGDFDMFDNESAADPTHAVFARNVFAPGWRPGTTVHLVHDAKSEPTSFFAAAWRVAWLALVPLLVMLALWLWMRTERIGPRLPAPVDARRSLLEHLQASGNHLLRHRRHGALYAAVLDAFERRLRRRDPYAAALDGAARVQAIAARTGWPEADVAEALATPRPRDVRDFVLRIARLLQLRQRL